MPSGNGLNINNGSGGVRLSASEPYANLILNQQIFVKALGMHFGIDPDNIIPTAGTTGAIEAVRNHVLKTSEKKHPVFLTVSPGYWRARESFQGLGFKAIDFKTQPSDFTIDEVEIVREIREKKPELVYLSLPNNPTGAVFDPDVIIERAPIETTIVLDLTLPSRGLDTKLLLTTLYDKFRGRKNLFLIGSTSKSHGTAEYRIGWTVCANRADAEELKAENRNAISTVAIAEGLKHIGKRATSNKTIDRSFSLLKRNAKEDRYKIVQPKRMVETTYVLIRSYVNVNRLRDILNENNIHVMWGSQFGLTDEYIRLDTLEPSSIKIFVGLINCVSQ
jgi:aspartate/methionine/tyrosine aminotransferase